MKTIKERAEEYADECWLSDGACFACEDGYIKGATEQQEIVIDKACEIYRKELTEIINIFNHLGKELYDIDELGELISLEGSINDFIKAMKGGNDESK